MADTALTIITDSLLDLGVLADNETPTNTMSSGALRKLNNLIDAWNIENLMVYGSTQFVFPLVGGQAVYTLGTGGNFNIPRPNFINSAFVRDLGQPSATRFDYPLYMYNDSEYASIALKGLTGTLPLGVWFDNAYPLINVTLSPVPTTSQYSLVFWADGAISNLALNDAINLAPGYKRALTANLAIELAPSYAVQPSDVVVSIARDSKSRLKAQNFQLDELEIDPRLNGDGTWNYITGTVQ